MGLCCSKAAAAAPARSAPEAAPAPAAAAPAAAPAPAAVSGDAAAPAGDIAALVQQLRDGSPAAKADAAAELLALTKEGDSAKEMRDKIAAQDPVVPIVELMRSADPSAQEKAVGVLRILASDAQSTDAIAAADGFVVLVSLLRDGTPLAQERAAAALAFLARNRESAIAIAAAGATGPLIDLIRRRALVHRSPPSPYIPTMT